MGVKLWFSKTFFAPNDLLNTLFKFGQNIVEHSACITFSFDIQKIFILRGSLWPLFCNIFEIFELTVFFCVLLTG